MPPVRIKFLLATVFVAHFVLAPRPVNAQFMFISGGDLTLTVNPPSIAGADPQPATNSSRRLFWIFSPRLRTKIVVSTIAPQQSFDLFVRATAVRGGRGAPELRLINAMPPTDFIVNIRPRRFFGRANLSYRAEAPAERGNSTTNGDDVHTVIYTWTAQ